MNRAIAPSAEQRAKQRKVAEEWMKFRNDHLLSQEDFGKLIGISRRTVQYVEHGNKCKPEWLCMPLPETLARFHVLKRKHEREAIAVGQ
ncbi:MAG TPA: hypothetical protein VK638_28625 [Edaphobacter sp.]|nr:hypothetical protein [Edaphobacter sp.]